MSRRLILMRHAEAQMTQYGKPDKDRIITMEGMHQLESLKQKLQGKLAEVDYVICSNAKRTRQTLDGIRSLLPTQSEITFNDVLYQGSLDQIWNLIREIKPTNKGVLILGHNPGLSQMIQWVADINGRNIRNFPTGGVALCTTKVNWSELSAPNLSLEEFILP